MYQTNYLNYNFQFWLLKCDGVRELLFFLIKVMILH